MMMTAVILCEEETHYRGKYDGGRTEAASSSFSLVLMNAHQHLILLHHDFPVALASIFFSTTISSLRYIPLSLFGNKGLRTCAFASSNCSLENELFGCEKECKTRAKVKIEMMQIKSKWKEQEETKFSTQKTVYCFLFLFLK